MRGDWLVAIVWLGLGLRAEPCKSLSQSRVTVDPAISPPFSPSSATITIAMALSNTLATHYNALFTCPFHQAVLASSLALGTTLYFLSPFRRTPPPRSIPSARITLGDVSTASLPYPPDLLPGGRWVKSPHGTFRAYEFGPTNGRRVLLIHGISTPCCVFRDMAHTLVEDGCRVLTFDLFGRGWSDAPTGVPYDDRLYIAQILYALYSSPESWARFNLVGYSLGGAVATSFAATMPGRIETLVLIAPAGILRLSKVALLSRLAITGYLPEAMATWMAKRRMGKRIMTAEQSKAAVDPADRSQVIDIPAVMEWQGRSHPGFIGSFMSSLKYAPLYDRQEEWAQVGKTGIKRVGLIMGETDDVIQLELMPEMIELLGGEDKVVTEVLKDTGHDLVARKGKTVAEFVLKVVD